MPNRPSLFASHIDNALVGATISVFQNESSGYTIQDLLTHRPSKRIRWPYPSPNDIRIRIVPDGSKQVDLFVLPVSNVDGEIVLTSSTGLNLTLADVPTINESGMSDTFAVDLRTLASEAQRTSSAWFDVALNNNTAAFQLGGFLGLYGEARPFVDRDFQWGVTELPIGYQAVVENEYGTEYLAAHRTQGTSYELTALISADDKAVVRDWMTANFVSAFPSFVWIDPDGLNVPIVGRVDGVPRFTETYRGDSGEAIEVAITYKALGKGKPVV